MRVVLLFVLLSVSSFLLSQDTTNLSLFDKLYTSQSLQITLTYPFDSLYKSNAEEIEARITIRSDSGMLMEDAPLSVNLRGKFRRMKCTMPPLLLNFKKSTLKELGLTTIDEMKLVTHCIEGEEGQNNLAEERMIYQVYESLTPLAYRTIWVTIEYCNSLNPGQCMTSAGFLLEPDKVISSRLGVEERKIFNVAEDSIHYESYTKAVAFNFLIGNRDWSLVASRNAKLFYNPSTGQYIVVPYDFDYSNVVGASYRKETRPKSMTHPYDRIYEGEYFRNKSGEMLKTFYGFEKSILDVVESANNPMDNERRKKLCRYFSNWFDVVKKKGTQELQYGIVFPYISGL